MSVTNVLSTCFWICLVFAIFFFLLSVVLFFVFDIKKIFDLKTGRAKRKTVRDMEAANASTGRLRVEGKTQTSKLSEKEKAIERAPAITPPTEKERKNYYNASESGGEETEVLYHKPEPTDDNYYPETSVLSQNVTVENVYNFSDTDKKIEMKIIKNEMYIHTNEMIS